MSTAEDDAAYELLASALKPAELSDDQRRHLRKRMQRAALAANPATTLTLRADDPGWVEIAPFIEMRLLRRDVDAGNQTSIMRMRPGGYVPPHRHQQEEEMLVLEGECCIGDLTLRAGDVHIAAAGSWHDAVTTRTGVLVMLRGEYPMPCPRPNAAS